MPAGKLSEGRDSKGSGPSGASARGPGVKALKEVFALAKEASPLLMKATPEDLIRPQLQELFAEFSSLSEEMGIANLGSKPLNKRLRIVTDMMSRAPDSSFPDMSNTDGELAGLYRFFNHQDVSPEKIFAPHLVATRERVSAFKRVLVAQDTSGISYGGKESRGLGRLNDGGNGYYVHGALALTAQRWPVPLGMLGYETLIRTQAPKKPRSWREERDDPHKESLRWPRLARVVEERLQGTATRAIHLMDREADDYELLAEMSSEGWGFIIRQKFNRLLELSTEAKRNAEPRKVREALEQAEVRIGRYVPLSPRKKDRSGEKQKTHPPREGRLARLCLSAARVCIRRPTELASKNLPQSIELNVVHVWEVDCPAEQHPVEWYLMTSEPIDTVEQILEVVDFYCARWVIEEFWKALKTGCAIEKRQLESSEALLNVLALSLPIAWRLLLLRSLARSAPEFSAKVTFSEAQIQILRQARPNLHLPPEPTLEQALYGVAALGGHRKHNGSPGWQTLGRGLEKLMLMELGWNLALNRPPEKTVQS